MKAPQGGDHRRLPFWHPAFRGRYLWFLSVFGVLDYLMFVASVRRSEKRLTNLCAIVQEALCCTWPQKHGQTSKNWCQISPNRPLGAQKSTARPSKAPFRKVMASWKPKMVSCVIRWQPKMMILALFLGPKIAKIGEKTRKIRCPKITWFFHWFYAGLGVVFQRFFNDFLESKFRGSLESDFVKKLTKHWPWRQNQGSAFWKVMIFLIFVSKIITFWQGRFRTDFWLILGGFWRPQIYDFRIFGLIFQDKFRVIFWKA